jgi:addiction module RelE/StbE family toxin
LPIWTESADADLQDIVAYIAKDSISQAFKVENVLLANADLLDTMPMMGKVGRAPDTRELVAMPNYLIVYELVNGKPEILRVKHAATEN